MTAPPLHVRPRVPSRAADFAGLAGLAGPGAGFRECPP